MIQSDQATALALQITQSAGKRAHDADCLALLRRINHFLDRHPNAVMRLDLRADIKRACK